MDADAAPPVEFRMYGFLRKLAAWFSGGPGRRRGRPAFQLEQLEDRSLPSASNLALPILSSNPAAPASIYLDFMGLPTQSWGSYQNVTTPIFHLDGSGPLFTANEAAVITEVWQRVAEIYSPFNINVTTFPPDNLSHGKTQIVAIGGSYNDWFHQAAGGITYVGSFANTALPNISHVFVDGTAGVAKDIAIAAAHEAGHGFGLEHQSILDTSGRLLQEYNSGDSVSAPLMGLAYNAGRALWWVGPTDTGAIQDDEAVIAAPTNGFGYRPDAYGQSFATATPLIVLNGQVGAVGVLDRPTSADTFSFTTSGGVASFAIDTAAVGPTLHARLELYSGSTLLGVGDSATSLGASISTTLGAGRYYLVVRSHGGYGDVGQYSLSGNAPTSPGTAGGAASQPLMFVLNQDQSLWQQSLASQQWAELSPAGSILSINASKDAAGLDEVFALASDHSLWVHQAAGWIMLSPAGTINALAASPNDAVFAIASDASLWEHTGLGWALLSPGGTILSVSAGVNAAGGAQAFAIASDHSLWQFDRSAWQMLSPGGTIASVSAQGDSAFAVASDGSVWKHTTAGWSFLSTPVSAASFRAATDASGNPALFVALADRSLWRYTAAQGWQQLLIGGGVQSIIAVQGKYVLELAPDDSLWQFDGVGWTQLAL